QLSNRDGVIQATSDRMTLRTRSGELDNQQGLIQSIGVLALETEALSNQQGQMAAERLVATNAGALNNRDGQLSATQLQLSTGELLNDNGVIVARGDNSSALTLHADTVTNSGTVASSGALTLEANTLDNTGTLSATEQLALAVTDITNDALLYSDASVAIDTDTFTNTGTVAASDVAVTGFDLLENSGRIESDRGNYQGQQLLNTATGVLVNADTGAETLVLDVAQLTNQGVLHNSSDSMSLGGDLRNSGQLIHAGSGQLLLGNQGTIDNNGGRIASAGDVRIENSVNGAGSVYAKQSMTLARSNGTLVNNSELYTEGTMQVSSALNNQGGSL
ncbi:hypothetical protein CWI84_11715, partial [Idiomarina tyrosinivorans]